MLPQDDPSHKDTPPASAPGLLVDAMLGRLARWLRLMGYDAAYWRTGSDDALLRQAQAEGRLIVTRDHGLAGRRGAWAVLIASEDRQGQMAEMRRFLSGYAAPAPFSRCPECNGLLAELPHDLARDLVPIYVWQTQSSFRRCPGCGRVYWRGTHFAGIEAGLV